MRRRLLHLAYCVYGLRWRIFHPVTVGVRLMLVHEGTVILIRHSYQEPWLFPGGGVKRGESLVEAAKREAHEEVGAVVLDEPRLIGIYTNFEEGKSDHVALFVTEEFRLEAPTDCWEIDEIRTVPLDALPADASYAIHRRVRDYRAGHRARTGPW